MILGEGESRIRLKLPQDEQVLEALKNIRRNGLEWNPKFEGEVLDQKMVEEPISVIQLGVR